MPTSLYAPGKISHYLATFDQPTCCIRSHHPRSHFLRLSLNPPKCSAPSAQSLNLIWKCHRARSKQSRLWGCRQQIRSSIEVKARFRLRENITALALVQHREVEQPSLQRYEWALRENTQICSIEKMGNDHNSISASPMIGDGGSKNGNTCWDLQSGTTKNVTKQKPLNKMKKGVNSMLVCLAVFMCLQLMALRQPFVDDHLYQET